MIRAVAIIAGTFGAIAGYASLGSASENVHYACADKTELTATFQTSPGSVVLVLSGSDEKMTLPQVLSADGGRYSEGDTEFWIKGREATLTRGQNQTTCKS